MNGCELLSEFRERRSEPAFAELVGRYTDLVFSVAKRRLLFVDCCWTSTFIVGKDGKIRGRDLIWEKLEEAIEAAIVE